MLARVFGLDLLRSIAIVFVLVAHGATRLLQPSQPNARIAAWLGVWGVELFFVLSGFLIGGILLRSMEKDGGLRPKGLWNFWIRRWFRTLPNYYLWLFINALLVVLTLRKGPVGASYLFFVQNLGWRIGEFYSESWSLAIEEWFYLVFPLLIMGLFWTMREHRRAYLVAGLLLVLVPPVLRSLVAADPAVEWNFDLRYQVLFHLDGIGFGALAAYMQNVHPARFRARTWGRAALGLFVLALFVTLAIRGFVQPTYRLFDTGPITEMPLFKILNSTVFSFSVSLLLPGLGVLPAPKAFLHETVYRTSLYSYSLYLCHVPAVSVLMHFVTWKHLQHVPIAWALFLGWMVASFLIAAATYHAFERPMTSLRERFAPDPKSAAPAEGHLHAP